MSKSKLSKFLSLTLSIMLALTLVLSAMVPVSAEEPEPDVEVPEIFAHFEDYDEETLRRLKFGEAGFNLGTSDGEMDELLKEAITNVKLAIDIDDEIYTNFEYYFYLGDGYYNLDSFYLTWRSDDWNSTINVQVTTDGKIQYFYSYSWTDDSNKKQISFAEITKEQALVNAETFLKNVLENEFDEFKLANVSLYYPSRSYSINYVINHDGFDYPDFNLSVEVDKITGEITSFYRNTSQLFDITNAFEFEDSTSTISREEALAAYLENIGLELAYASYFDWQTRELTIQPVYRLTGNNWSQVISAVDGGLVTLDFDIRPAAGGGMDNGGAVYGEPEPMTEASNSGLNYDRARAVQLSPAEEAAIESVGDIINHEEAFKKAVEALELDIDANDYSVNVNFQTDYINQNQHLWSINLSRQERTVYENHNFNIDAKTGDIISYYGYHNDYSRYYGYIDFEENEEEEIEEPEYLYTYEEALGIATAKVKELLPDYADFEKDFARIDRINNYEITPVMLRRMIMAGEISPDVLIEQIEEIANAKQPSYYFYWVRTANGLNFGDNSIVFMLDNETGKITNYGLTWYQDAKFPAVDNIVSEKAALEEIADFGGYNIYYASNGRTEDDSKVNVSLIYRFDNTTMVDPFTGKAIGWDFKEPVIYEYSIPNYQDLEDHWVEETVKILSDNGIYVREWGGENFNPDKEITRGEFYSYLEFYRNFYWYTGLESSVFVRSDAYINTMYDPIEDADKIITKQEAIKIVCDMVGYGKIAEYPEIFVYPFGDEDGCDEEYRGHIAILKALGIIEGDGNGNFNAKKEMTRAESAVIVYNIIIAAIG
ncbi:MAG: S-layer homology domain-containing protein [Oscillospiraceae bacterium]|nr:S-layer homology domain-containing protein [Oscillospiraceae bacterium]